MFSLFLLVLVLLLKRPLVQVTSVILALYYCSLGFAFFFCLYYLLIGLYNFFVGFSFFTLVSFYKLLCAA